MLNKTSFQLGEKLEITLTNKSEKAISYTVGYGYFPAFKWWGLERKEDGSWTPLLECGPHFQEIVPPRELKTGEVLKDAFAVDTVGGCSVDILGRVAYSYVRGTYRVVFRGVGQSYYSQAFELR